MQFQLLSDLHLEFSNIDLPGGNTLLLAGDIICADYLRPMRTDKDAKKLIKYAKRFFFEDCAKYDKVFYVMGNHEHYSGIWGDTLTILREFIEGSNVTLLEKESADLGDDTVLWGATLWTDLSNNDPMVANYVQRGMNDYHYIQKFHSSAGVYGSNYYHLRTDDTFNDNQEALGSLKDFLCLNKDKKIVVMTHHTPSSQSAHPRYGYSNPMNYAYHNELHDIMLDNPHIKAWVHGHTHDSWDYMIGETRVLCNPRGYAYPNAKPGNQENTKFIIDKTFEV